MLTQLLDSIENPQPVPSTAPSSASSSKGGNPYQEAMDQAQLIFDVKWGQAAQAWDVLQSAKQAHHNFELAKLQKEADRQLKIQQLVEIIRCGKDEKPKPAAKIVEVESQEDIRKFNEQELDLDRKRKRSEETERHYEKMRQEHAARTQAAADAKETGTDDKMKEMAYEAPKPKARPKTSPAAKELPPADLNKQLAKMGYKISLEKVKTDEGKESVQAEPKKDRKKPDQPDGPPPNLGTS